ncbi:MAG TPA: ATP-dependent Clp protease ATP-binding subunit ClpC, partial [Syntrophomonas wolfei]|nr:ATP-dependent Clp protease ATP-binding subunit ClpC [Syntrophomonas wolfei]
GFTRAIDEAHDYSQMKERVMEQLKHTFKPEFMNRIDEIIVFQNLNEQELKEIVDLLLLDLKERVKENGYDMEISPAARELILKEGYDPAFGARPLKRAIQKLVEDSISEEILKKNLLPGDRILVDAEEGHIIAQKASKK